MQSKASVSDFANQLQEQVTNHSIYIWAASGELCKDINEDWIRKKEARSDGGKHTDDAIAAWEAVMKTPYRAVARAFDCSGYVSYCLKQIGAMKGRTNCDGLYAKCEPLDISQKPKDGTLLFRVNSKNYNDETHVGVYINGYQFHAKGRNHGVVREKYKKSFWTKAGWFKEIQDSEPSPKPEPTPTPTPEPSAYIFTRNLKYGCRGGDVVELKKLLISHGYTKGITVDTKSSEYFGSSTRKLVKQYQKDRKLKVDGVAGHDTITSLGGIYLQM